MRKEKKSRIKKKNLALYLYMILILMSLLSVASYTWFSLSQTPRVSDLYMFINTQTGMEIALTPDSTEWGQQLDFRDMVDVTTPLRPVTWSENDQRFYAAVYGIDGRLTGQWEPLTDERHANKDNLDGYYIKASFYARTGQAVDVSLSPAIEVEEGVQGSGTYLIGYPEWDGEEIVHNNHGRGAECAVRIGFRTTPVDVYGEELGESSPLIIYEPNSNLHVEGATGYIPTPSIDGTEGLVDEDRLILQTMSTWSEADPVQRDVVMHHLGFFTTDTKLFVLTTEHTVRIDIYVWLEGQDVDCTNEIHRAQILASIQFSADVGNQGGMTPIEPEEETTDQDALNNGEDSEERDENPGAQKDE